MLKSEELINKVKEYNRFLNPQALTKAYNFALNAHKKQKRDEGVPYINHPVAVADILSDLKLDSATITTDFFMIPLKILTQLIKLLKKNLVKRLLT